MPLTAGTKLDGYEILDLIGAGGMGEVYRARDAALKREVAIEILPSFVLHDADRLSRFKHEAQGQLAEKRPIRRREPSKTRGYRLEIWPDGRGRITPIPLKQRAD